MAHPYGMLVLGSGRIATITIELVPKYMLFKKKKKEYKNQVSLEVKGRKFSFLIRPVCKIGIQKVPLFIC